MPGLFDDLPDAGAAQPQGAPSAVGGKGLFDDLPSVAPPQPSQRPGSHAPDDGGMTWRAQFLPFGEDAQGKTVFAVPESLHSIYNTAKKVTSGQGPETATIEDVFNTAGLAAGGAPGKLLPAAEAQGARNAALEAAARLPEVGSLPRSVASDNPTVQMFAGGMQKLPGIGSPLQNAAQDTARRLGLAADRVARDTGGGTPQSAFSGGSAAKEGLADWITQTSKDIVGKGYDDLDKLVKADTKVPLVKTSEAVQKLQNLDIMSASDDGQKVIKLVQEAVSRPNGLSYAGIKELRTRIGERVFGDIAPEQGTSARALDMIYGALSDDLRTSIRKAGTAKSGSSGKKAIAAFDAANEQAKQTFAVRKSLKSIIGAQADAPPERVLDRIARMASSGGNADLVKLTQARSAIGDNWGEVASAVINRLGRDNDGNFSPARFLTDYGKISDNGKNVLFGGNGELRQALDDIHAVSQKFMTSAGRYTNTSNTATADAAMAGIAGGVAAPISTLVSVLGGRTVAWALARPQTAQATARWVRAYAADQAGSNDATRVVLRQAGAQLMSLLSREQEAGNGD